MVRVALLPVLIALGACRISTPSNEQHPSVRRSPVSEEDTDESRHATVRLTAARDLECERVDVVLTLERQYANTAVPRFVIEGCGRRALYAETCEDYPRCRYLLLSVVPVPSPGAPAP